MLADLDTNEYTHPTALARRQAQGEGFETVSWAKDEEVQIAFLLTGGFK